MKNQLIERLQAETPIWFKRIRSVSVKISGICISLLGASLTIPGFTLPSSIQTVCTYLIVAGITAGCVSTTAKV